MDFESYSIRAETCNDRVVSLTIRVGITGHESSHCQVICHLPHAACIIRKLRFNRMVPEKRTF